MRVNGIYLHVRPNFRSMQKLLILFITIFISGATGAQTALIRDTDGYCNIRESAGSQTKVVDTLHNDRIVFVFLDAAEGDWLPVDYYKDNKSPSDQTLSGYIHKSRIVFLSDLAKFRELTLNDSTLKLRLDSFRVTMTVGGFERKGRRIQYARPQGEQRFVKAINDKFPWGTDGNIPRKEYKTIQFKSGNRVVRFPANTFKDLFEPNLDMTMAYFDKASAKFYIEAFNSDGAGSYLVIWTLKDRQIIGRETFIPF